MHKLDLTTDTLTVKPDTRHSFPGQVYGTRSKIGHGYHAVTICSENDPNDPTDTGWSITVPPEDAIEFATAILTIAREVNTLQRHEWLQTESAKHPTRILRQRDAIKNTIRSAPLPKDTTNANT